MKNKTKYQELLEDRGDYGDHKEYLNNREPYPAEYNEGMDYSHLMNSLDGYSKEYGDCKLINVIKEWLSSRMGGKWIIQSKRTGLKTVSY